MAAEAAMLLFLLIGCPGGDDKAAAGDTALLAVPCDPTPRPGMSFDVDEVDFGYVPTGASATQTVTVENDGAAPLGVGTITSGESSEFPVSWELPDCARESSDGLAIVLDPGCALDVAVTYTPATSGGTQAALIVDGAEETAEYGPDPIHARRVTWLRGTTDGAAVPSDPFLVGDVIRLEQTAMLAGDTIAMEGRAAFTGTLLVSWSTDGDGTIGSPTSLLTSYTAPLDVGGGRNENLYLVVLDSDGHQDWAFDKVAVLPRETELYPCD